MFQDLRPQVRVASLLLRDKGFITASDLKNSLSLYLEFPVTEQEINDFMEEADLENTGNVSFKEFLKLCKN